MSTEPAEAPPSDSRTLIASVLFVDIAGYSRFGVTEQIRLKQSFNDVLSAALQDTEARERVLIDTGDGAAVAFLGNPERALFAALSVFDNVGELPVRMGINMGPVHVSRDINGQETISDAGTQFIISGPSRESVEAELARLGAEGAKVLAAPALVGAKWMATCENRRAMMRVNVEKLGMKSIITAPTREALEAKLKELLGFGARLDGGLPAARFALRALARGSREPRRLGGMA